MRAVKTPSGLLIAHTADMWTTVFVSAHTESMQMCTSREYCTVYDAREGFCYNFVTFCEIVLCGVMQLNVRLFEHVWKNVVC